MRNVGMLGLLVVLGGWLMTLAACDIGAENDALDQQEMSRQHKVTTVQDLPPGLGPDVLPPSTQPAQ